MKFFDAARSKRAVAGSMAALLWAAVFAVVALPAPAQAADPCGPTGNKIACENSKPGTPSNQWQINGSGDPGIQGFSSDISVNVGGSIDFKIDSYTNNYDITIYRSGYYGGDGAREIATIPRTGNSTNQPSCINDAATDLIDCGNWSVSASWNVPANAVSGVYFAHLFVPGDNSESHITFVVRDDASTSDVVFQTSDTTWQAYNRYGGANFYQGGAIGRALKLSYNRPVTTRSDTPWGRDFYYANEYPMVRFMEKNGYDVSYIAGIDTDRRGGLLTNHKTFISTGHDEYWSGQQRANVEAARDAGVNLMFLSGNEMYWRTRYEPSIDGTNTDYRTLVCYKETWSNAKIDPSPEWTGTWRDPRFAPQSAGAGLPENGTTGTAYMANFTDLAIKVGAAEGKYRLWRNTSVANLSAGQTATLAPHTIGYESNEDLDNGHRPKGLIRLASTTGPTPEYLLDYGNTTAPGTTTHSLTLYRAPSGALVFSAGTIQWSWGLDDEHDTPYAYEPADPRMQQAQVNLFADMGVQPTTLDSALTAATASTDTAAPTVAITSPANGTKVPSGSQVTLTGSASDTGGGKVAGVEVSTDNGSTWHPADGTTAWSFTYVQKGVGVSTVKVRAIDDSANIGSNSTRDIEAACPCNIFGETVPPVEAANDPSAVELGVRFHASTDGFVTGVRFYKGAGNGGTHVGSLWSTAGERLATATFTGESSTGWQSVTFDQAVPVSSGVTYVASYTAPQGRYAYQAFGFAGVGVDADPLFVNGGFGSTPAGVYANPGQFPSNSYQQANYFVDVTFTTIDESPLRVNSAQPLPGSSSVPTNSTISAVFSKPLEAGTQSISVTYQGGTTVAGATSYDPVTRRITFTPNGGLLPATDYTVTVQGTDTLGNTVSEGGSWTFRSAAPQNPEGVCPCSLFADSDVPTVLDGNDPDAVTLGVRFAPIQDGVISAIRFYKGPGNTGSHTGTLWSVNGTALATGTFQNESTQGWQTLEFDPPIPVTANTDYVASYRAEAGHYSLNVNEFASTNLSRGPLVVAFNSGSYTYGTGYPGAKSTHNYLVDVQFEPIPTSINIVTMDPPDGAVDVSRASTVDVWFSSQIQPGATLTVENGATAIAGTTSIVGSGKSLVFTPNQPLPRNATLDVTLRNVTSTDGAALPDRAWSFTTADSADVTPVETLFGSLPPEVELVNDPSAIELGTAFTASADGEVTGVRFFKGGPANGGTHTGSLWDAAGTRLATVEFTNETSNGWQQATFDTPVAVTAGTTYVVSYFAPQGNYSATSGFFDTEWTSGSLTARATANGLYYYGSAGGFPQGSFGATNYFVDAMYRTGSAGPAFAVTGRSPVADAADVARGEGVSVTFTEPLAAGYAMSVRSGGNDIAGSVALNGAGTTLTFTPTGSYPAGATVNVVVSGLVAASGATAPNESWSFQTVPATPVTITGRTPSADATDVNRTDPVSVTFNEPITAAGQLTLRNGGSSINGSQTLSGNGLTLTFTPAGTLPADTLLTAEVTGVVSTDGASLATASWTFRTAPRPTLTASMFSGLTPATASASSSRAITVGTHFTPSTNGSVTAIKFYKGSANTGTHTASLWTAGGTRLARATVTGETASGWQTMVLPTPVDLTAGQSYVVSYQAPVGRYSITNGFFTNTPHTVGPLTATRAQNGRYRYTTNASAFPNQISTGSNLFVDVVFSYLGQ